MCRTTTCIASVSRPPDPAPTTDGDPSIFNGALDWVYNAELATRAAQPAYAWSPDGQRLLYLRLDDSAVRTTRSPTTVRCHPRSVTPLPDGRAPRTRWLLCMRLERKGTAPPGSFRFLTGRIHLPRFTWTPTAGKRIYMTVNRDHKKNLLELPGWHAAPERPGRSSGRTDPDWINEDPTHPDLPWAMARNSCGCPSATVHAPLPLRAGWDD